nr:NAD(P)/FAD-dependent oxidoreductase [Saprospiraceae bacterium]
MVILGNGISGTTAARFIRKLSNYEITIVSEETDHFFSRTALMYIYMGHMKYEHTKPYEDFFWKKNRLNLIRGRVKEIDFDNKNLLFDPDKKFDTIFPAPAELTYDYLILAVGSQPNRFNWPGQDLNGVNGLYSFQDLQYMEQYTEGIERGVIVGGGLIGVEMAEMMASRKIPVTFLVRESAFYSNNLPKEEAELISRHLKSHGIDLRLNTELKEITADEHGRCSGVITSKGDEVPCQFVGLTAGVHPNIDFLSNSGLQTDKGILVDEYLETNFKGVFAIGDCAQLKNPPEGRKPIEPVWYTGRIMGETAAHTICGKPQVYNPGIWFNSAKFFDIEYQVYGNVPPENPPEIKSIYWESENGKKSIRINYLKEEKCVTGFNLMGVRFRQEICEQWIAHKTPITEVLKNISAAAFDPELTSNPEKNLVKQYEIETGTKIPSTSTRGWGSALKVLRKLKNI